MHAETGTGGLPLTSLPPCSDPADKTTDAAQWMERLLVLPPRAPPRALDKTLPARDLSHILATKVRVMHAGGGGEEERREGREGRT